MKKDNIRNDVTKIGLVGVKGGGGIAVVPLLKRRDLLQSSKSLSYLGMNVHISSVKECNFHFARVYSCFHISTIVFYKTYCC
jgi:hypothetical protein